VRPHLSTPLCAALTLALIACSGERTVTRAEAPPKTTTAEETPVSTPMQPSQPTEMTDGAALTPADALLTWLEANAKRGEGHALMQLPVVVRFRPDKLGAAGAHIGTTPGPAPEGALELDLTDTALGVGVWQHIRQRCDLNADACALWLEGYWRALLPMPGLPGLAGPTAHPFDVRGIGEAVDPGAATVRIAR